MQRITHTLAGLLLASSASLAFAQTAAPDNAKVFFISPKDGATVSSPVTVQFGLEVAPAGVEREATGHHHLLIDTDTLPPAGQPIPADDHHVHFGGGQTQTSLELTPGEHTLQLIVGDHHHMPLSPSVTSEQITITVE